MTTPATVVLEQLTHVTPFGLGLWDLATGRLVSDGLTVRVFRGLGRQAFDPVEAHANRSGLFVAQDFPSLRAFESSRGDLWETTSPPQPFLVEVRDTLERFTAFVMQVSLPHRGLVVPQCIADVTPSELAPSSPPPEPVYVPLFSTASRPAPAGMAAVRATLIVADTDEPAEYAVLEVRESGRLLARGIADDRGEVAALFAYPEPLAPPASSPPSSPPGGAAARPRPLAEQEWALDIAVRYDRNLLRYTPDPARPPLADLCELLRQPLATVMTSSPPVTLSEAPLCYGEELVLGADVGAQLIIRPA